MFVYSDFKYVEYILDSDLETGIYLYNQCIQRINERIEEKDENMLFQTWLQDNQNMTFGQYKSKMYGKMETKETRIKEQDRIFEQTKKIENYIKNNQLKGVKVL